MKRLAAASCLLLLSCSTTTTVYRINGAAIDGHLAGGDSRSVVVNGVIIDRDDIVEVDYPGNVHSLVGAIIGGLGTLNVLAGCPEDTFTGEPRNRDWCGAGVIELVVGVPMMIWGIATNQSAKAKFNSTSLELERPEPERPRPAEPPLPSMAARATPEDRRACWKMTREQGYLQERREQFEFYNACLNKMAFDREIGVVPPAKQAPSEATPAVSAQATGDPAAADANEPRPSEP